MEGAERLPGARLAALVDMETSGELTATQAKAVLAEMVETGRHPKDIAQARGFEAMSAGALGRPSTASSPPTRRSGRGTGRATTGPGAR